MAPQLHNSAAHRRLRGVGRKALSQAWLAPGAFAAPLADPRGRDVVVTVSRHLLGFGPNVRATTDPGIVEFLDQDKCLIEQEMSTCSAAAGG